MTSDQDNVNTQDRNLSFKRLKRLKRGIAISQDAIRH